MGHLEADLGRPVDRVVRLPERLDRGPVDDAVGRGQGTPAARPQSPEQRGGGHVGPHEANTTEHFGQIEVGGPDDLHAVDVDQLVVEDVLGQEHLTRTPDDVTQVEPGRAQQDLGVRDAIDGRGRDEGQPPAHLDDQARHRRVGLPVGPAGHDVLEPADLLTGLIRHGPPQNARQGHDGVEDALGREDAAGAAAALVRRTLGRLAASGKREIGTGRRFCRRGWSHGAISCAAPCRRSGRNGRRGARWERHPKEAGTSTFSIPTPAMTSGRSGRTRSFSRRRRGEVCR